MFKYISSIMYLICLVFSANDCFSQKPPIDILAIENWPEIQYSEISNNGKFVLYTVSQKSMCNLYIQSSDNSFKRVFIGLPSAFRSARFTEDSQKAVFMQSRDRLGIVDLYSNSEYFIPNCNSYKMPENGSGEWLACLSSNKDLIVLNLSSGEKRVFSNVKDYVFSFSGKVLLIRSEAGNDVNASTLKWVDMVNGNVNTIWQGLYSGSYTFDKSETKLSFVVAQSMDGKQNSIFYYIKGMNNAHVLIKDDMVGLNDALIKDSELKFSSKGDKLFFRVAQSNDERQNLDAASVDVWNYKDRNLQEEQLQLLKRNNSFLAVIDLDNNKVIILNKEGDLLRSRSNEGGNLNYIIENRVPLRKEPRRSERSDLCIISTKDGTRSCIEVADYYADFSPGGRFVIWFDKEKRAYYTYDLQSKLITNITNKIKFPLYNESWDGAALASPYQPEPLWLENDESVFIYDRYDIWQVDPTGNHLPINVTNGFGRRKKIFLRYLYENKNYSATHEIKKESEVILCGFNEINKNNGFLKVKLGSGKDPELLSMNSAVFYFPRPISWTTLSSFIKKAKYNCVYLLTKESAKEYPNLVLTKDFKEFTLISNLQPQNNYNWLTSELLQWKTFDGQSSSGILYKPQNFDPQKKYPVILHIYEKLSNGLNQFLMPELSNGSINIPHFVSNGYLVFCPDIKYTLGKPGESAYNYVVSAAKMLSNKPWVNGNKISIEGHSFGGYEVNYIITKTKMFAAAVSAAGVSDLISQYGTLMTTGSEGQAHVEFAQSRMAVTLWEDRIRYINNSPLFNANKIETPVLIMHNKTDRQVAWGQGVELFTALRRLGKKAWMLQYDEKGNGHIITDYKNQKDYTIRLFQFFDHYLNEVPAPLWMTRGVTAKMKGIDRGLELDIQEGCSENCKVCKKNQKK